MGKIIPASSTNGEDIFFTPDASGNGTTLKSDAKFYQVASLASAGFANANIFGWDSDEKKYVAGGAGDKARTTLHAITNVDASADTWNPANPEGNGNTYDSADAWNITNDDGYYVDIPVWFRNSAKEDATLAVDAYVTTNAGRTQDANAASDDELYLAARAAIIYTNSSSASDSTNLLRIRKDGFAATTSVTDFMYSTNSTGDAVSGVGGTSGFVPTYGEAVEYDGAVFLTVPGREESTTAKYGTMVKAVVRVWLEGEDPNCWNPNAGQDFNISLKFVKGGIGDKLDATKNANEVLFPADYDKGDADQAANLNVDASSVVTITETINGAANTEIKFTYDGNKWNQTTGSVEILDGKTYTISNGTAADDQTVTGADGIAAWLKEKVTKKSDLSKTYTITASGS